MGLPFPIFGLLERPLDPIQIGAPSLLHTVQTPQDEARTSLRVLAGVMWPPEGDFSHIFWTCPSIVGFWGGGSGLAALHSFQPFCNP